MSDKTKITTEEVSEESTKNKPKTTMLGEILEWAEAFAFSMLIVILAYIYIFRVVQVEGPSMNNTLTDGDRVVIFHLNYTPERDDIVVVAKDEEKNIIKRVIGIEGDDVIVDYNTDTVTVNGVKISNEHNKETMEDTYFFDNTYMIDDGVYEYKVPEDCIFIMGDNRNISADSRINGFISEDTVMGKVVLRIYPFNSLGIPD